MKQNILIQKCTAVNHYLTTRLLRFDPLSLVSRQSVLPILVACLTVFGVGNAWGDEHVTLYWSSDDDTSTQKNFTATSGSVTGVLSFSSSGNSGSTPAYNSSDEQLRLYYASNGKGGSVTITAADGVTFTSFEIGSATKPTTKYTVSGGSATEISFTQTTDDYFGNLYYGGADVSTTSIKIQNCNTSNTQLRIYYIYLEYTVASCSADPSTANASINGSFTLTSLTDAVSVSSGTWGTGSNDCAWIDYGFVWGTTSSPTVSNNKVQVGTSGKGTSWSTDATHKVQPSGSTNPTSWSVGTTYYVKAYGKNGKDGAAFAYSTTAAYFTLRSIDFEENGGSTVNTIYANSGGTATKPSDPTKTGYTFGGWYKEVGLSNAVTWASDAISENKTYYAKWSAKTYAITLNGNGGTGSSPVSVNATYNAHALSAAITNPEKTDYIFEGWNTKADGSGLTVIGTNGELISSVSGYTDASGNWTKDGTETLYAKWTEHTYTNYRTSCCTDPGLAYETGSVDKTFGDGTFTNALTNTNSVSVTYTSSDETVATVDTDGEVTILKAGTTTITATSAAQKVSTVDYCADEASYTLTVNKANISPTLTYTPNSVAVGENTSAPTVGGNPGSGGVTYDITSATPAGCATINTSTGVVTGVAVGSVTITATVAATDNYNGGSATANVTITAASYFPNGKTIFIQAESASAWSDANYDCVKAWFHTAGGSETTQTTYWLFDATGGDSGKKLFAAIVPATGDLPYLDIQRFTHDCSYWRNKNGGCSYSDANGSNTIRSTGNTDTYDAQDDYIRWNATGVTMNLMSSDAWLTPVATVTDQGGGVWSGTYEYTPSNTSTEYVIATNYNGNIGNTGSNSNATLSDMVVGSTYDVTATLDIKDHSLEMSKTFVKGTVHFNLQGHGLAISDLTNVTAGSKISAPSPAPSATGYTFGGWFTDAECTDEWTFASDEVNETMTLYAKWTANVYTITKTLTNVSNTGLPASFTYTGATTTALNSTFTVDATNFFLPSSIAVTMGGTPLTAGTDYTYNNSTGAFTFDRIISGNIVITASATAKLKSIAITTQPTTRKYFAGESFRSTGAVVTATMGDGSTKTVSATWTPSGALSAGTSQTVTASYSEGGIDQTATTTIDVYSVTVNKKNEDGDAIDVAGVTATWTVGTKALAAGIGSTKYAFKEWQVTGATAASTTSASTTLSNPTANVVVNAVFWKPRVVKWSVNGDDSYATGGPTTEVAYNGTISTIPTAPSGLVCASTFVAWTDAAHNNGTTAKASTSYYESKLFTAANQFPNITAETTTFYAVFAEGTGAAVNTTMWGETWTDATVSNGSSGQSDANPDDNCSTTKGTTIYGAASISYTQSDNSNVYCRNENSAGGTAPELYIKSSNSWTISGIPTGGAATLSLTYATNKTPTVTVSTTELGKTPTISGANKDKTITTDGASTITIQFSTSENTRVDNVELRVATVSLTNYVTECDANIVKVTYDANGGSTSCTNTTTDKTEDFTVCSSAPTRDYYTFAGWLCSADDEVYAASATIDADAIDADFTLTAQWTPVTYNITYELDGGTNNVGNPATYNVTTATITLQDPTKGHDRFEGWYSTYSAGVYSDPVTEIPLGSHDNITLYAKWTERHEIVFDYTESASSGTTTIYRADDENLEDAVAGMGSVPDDPDAPTACSSKVFVGWSESTIDDETDTEPADLFDGTGAVDEDKHYYAVWATSTSGSKTLVMEITRADFDDSYHSGAEQSHTSTAVANDGSGATLSVSWKSVNVGDFSSKIQVKDASGAGFWNTTDLGSISSVSITTGNNITHFENTSVHPTSTSGTTKGYFTVTKSGGTGTATKVTVTFTKTVSYYIAYSTSCCATKVTLSENSPEHGTIVFGKTKVPTCGDKEVSLTITPEAGYQLHSYDVATGGGKVATKNVSPAISLDNNSSAAQNITLTFADEANGAYDVTASFSKMAPTAWAWTYKSEAIPNPINLYVGQTATLNATYTPSGLLNSEQNYNVTKSANLTQTSKTYATPDIHYTFRADATMDDGTVTLTNQINSSLTITVHVHVDPLPLTHFEDLVHGKAFADVEATLVDNALSATKTTPTSDDWTTPNANTCEENHLHLVGWIREDWPALVAYLVGTGDAPSTTAIVGAGNDGSGNAYFFAPNASINVQTFDGVTFYAVWAEIK